MYIETKTIHVNWDVKKNKVLFQLLGFKALLTSVIHQLKFMKNELTFPRIILRHVITTFRQMFLSGQLEQLAKLRTFKLNGKKTFVHKATAAMSADIVNSLHVKKNGTVSYYKCVRSPVAAN